MEPNQDIQNMDAMPSNVAGVDASGNSSSGKDIVFKDSSKSGKGMAIGMAFLAILAAGGIGFGVWAMLDGNQKVDKLNAKVNELNGQLDSMEAPEDESEPVDEFINEETVNTADYIYIGEWGLKIEIPEGLNNVWYSYVKYSDSKPGDGALSVSGVVGDGFPDFINPNNNADGLGGITRVEAISDVENGGCVYSSFVFSDENYNYCYSHPQAVFSTDDSTEDLELKSVDAIEKMLRDKSNYSKI